MTETLDHTQFLPRKAPVVNRWRMAHGDLAGEIDADTKRIIHAQVRDDTTVQNLIQRGFLEDYHLYYGLTLLELRNAFLGPLRVKVNAACLEGLLGRGVSRKYAQRMYDDITRQLKLSRVRIIERACNHPYATDPAAQVIAGIEVYRRCFERLERAMDEAVAAVKREIEEKGVAND